MGRRGTEDFTTQGSKATDQGAEGKSSKRRLFSGVLDRFDRADNVRSGGGSGGDNNATDIGNIPQSPKRKDGSEARKWLTPARSRAARSDGSALDPNLLGVPASGATGASASASAWTSASASGTEPPDELARTASGTWVKPGKTGNPDRFARFLGKMLGVRDDAMPDGQGYEDGGGGSGGGGSNVTGGAAAESRNNEMAQGAVTSDAIAAGASATNVNANASTIDAETNTTRPSATSTRATTGVRGSGTTGVSGMALEATPVSVYSATTVAHADAIPVAVAVALPVADGQATGRETTRAERRSNRPSPRAARSQRTASAAGGGARAGRDSAGAGTRADNGSTLATSGSAAATAGLAVSISEWAAKEQRESGGTVRVFSAQQVVDGKVQKRSRLAVSPKNMTQVPSICCCRDFCVSCPHSCPLLYVFVFLPGSYRRLPCTF